MYQYTVCSVFFQSLQPYWKQAELKCKAITLKKIPGLRMLLWDMTNISLKDREQKKIIQTIPSTFAFTHGMLTFSMSLWVKVSSVKWLLGCTFPLTSHHPSLSPHTDFVPAMQTLPVCLQPPSWFDAFCLFLQGKLTENWEQCFFFFNILSHCCSKWLMVVVDPQCMCLKWVN